MFDGPAASLFEAMARLEPTVASAAPSVWNSVFALYSQRLDRLAAQRADAPRSELESSVLDGMSSLLGSRLTTIVTGGSSTSADVMSFLGRCFKCEVIDRLTPIDDAKLPSTANAI